MNQTPTGMNTTDIFSRIRSLDASLRALRDKVKQVEAEREAMGLEFVRRLGAEDRLVSFREQPWRSHGGEVMSMIDGHGPKWLEDQWKTVAMAAGKVVPEVVGRSLDEWFATHGIGADVEKSREAMEKLGRFADSMVPKEKIR